MNKTEEIKKIIEHIRTRSISDYKSLVIGAACTFPAFYRKYPEELKDLVKKYKYNGY